MRVFRIAVIRDLWIRGALNSEDKHEGTSMIPKLGKKKQGGHLANGNHLAKISAFEYVCKGGEGWGILETQLLVKSLSWRFLGN